jgi:hypothetical protein
MGWLWRPRLEISEIWTVKYTLSFCCSRLDEGSYKINERDGQNEDLSVTHRDGGKSQ